MPARRLRDETSSSSACFNAELADCPGELGHTQTRYGTAERCAAALSASTSSRAVEPMLFLLEVSPDPCPYRIQSSGRTRTMLAPLRFVAKRLAGSSSC